MCPRLVTNEVCTHIRLEQPTADGSWFLGPTHSPQARDPLRTIPGLDTQNDKHSYRAQAHVGQYMSESTATSTLKTTSTQHCRIHRPRVSRQIHADNLGPTVEKRLREAFTMTGAGKNVRCHDYDKSGLRLRGPMPLFDQQSTTAWNFGHELELKTKTRDGGWDFRILGVRRRLGAKYVRIFGLKILQLTDLGF